MICKSEILNKEIHRYPYPNGKTVKCPDCGEKHELIRISETTGAFECLKCKKTFHAPK